jgi:hypothetical protein
MKVCTKCNLGYQDNVSVCSRCGNRNLIYYNNNGVPVNTTKNNNIKFGELFKGYFKSPLQAKQASIACKDYGSSLIWNAITLFSYFLFAICIQGGIAIRYSGSISAVLTLVYPIIMFIIIFGFQFLDVFLYAIFTKNRRNDTVSPALGTYIFISSSRILPVMILAFVSLISLASPIAGGILLVLSVISLSIYTSVSAKINVGATPVTFLESFLFALTGIVSFIFAVAFVALFVYIFVRTSISSLLLSYLDF